MVDTKEESNFSSNVQKKTSEDNYCTPSRKLTLTKEITSVDQISEVNDKVSDTDEPKEFSRLTSTLIKGLRKNNE